MLQVLLHCQSRFENITQQTHKHGTGWAISVLTTAWGGGGRGTVRPLLPLQYQGSYGVPRGGVRKLSTRSPRGTFKILRLTWKLGTRSGQRSHFDVSVWWRLGPAISIDFARNSVKITSKGYWGYLAGISVILCTGRVKVRSRKVTRIKNFFRACDTWFIVNFARRTKKNQSHFAIWLLASQRQRRVRSTPGHIRSTFRIGIFEYKRVFLNQFYVRIRKHDIFISVRCPKVIKIAVWKNDINVCGFWAICSAKIDISNWHMACHMSRHCSTAYIPVIDVCIYFYERARLFLVWTFMKVHTKINTSLGLSNRVAVDFNRGNRVVVQARHIFFECLFLGGDKDNLECRTIQQLQIINRRSEFFRSLSEKNEYERSGPAQPMPTLLRGL